MLLPRRGAVCVGGDLRRVRRAVSSGRPRGFTLTDLLVSLAVIAVLVSLMLPSLSKVRETAQQVICRSTVRQIGLGLAMYAESYADSIPTTTYVGMQTTTERRPAETVTLRLAFVVAPATHPWDGLGLLYAGEFLQAPKISYCPAHTGDHRFVNYADSFGIDRPGRIVGNYQYRGQGPNGATKLTRIEPSQSALVADGMRTQADYNHRVGSNVLRADVSVYWYNDPRGNLLNRLSEGGSPTSASDIEAAWFELDQPDR